MSKYVTQVRWIVENNSKEFAGFPMGTRVAESCKKIFNFYYPIWDEKYRQTLEKKILMHYFTKEIGFETVELWRFYTEERLNLIMPYYNELYKTIAREYDWLTNYDYTETFQANKKLNETVDQTGNTTIDQTGETKTSDTGETKTNNKEHVVNTGSAKTDNKTLGSDLPQANYAGVDYGTNLTELDGKVATNDDSTRTSDGLIDSTNNVNTNTKDNTLNTSKVNSDRNNKSDEEYTRKLKGYQGRTPTELMMEYRNALLNIDNMIVEELWDLFMTIY